MYKTKVLIVDDKPQNILALANLLAAPDVEIISATSGNDALEMLLKHDVALALLDVQMPVLNGFELAQLMRSAERSKNIPIIFVTASQRTDESIFAGYDHGAVDYLTKPLDPHIVRSKVRVFIELDQRTWSLQQKTEALAQKLHEVEVLRDAAEAANRAKSRFLANMSHEIRTPLGAVLGFSELIRVSDQSEEERQTCIKGIERNGKLLLTLIDDILDLSKIEADRIEAERIECCLPEVMQDVKVVHAVKAAEQGVKLTFKPATKLPLKIFTDPVRLKQILNNIIGNAIKFTNRGEVTVHISFQHSVDQKNGRLIFRVEDTGCGLSSFEAERIFQPFMQADSSTRRRFGGTGLGLVISRNLANILGGDVVLVSSQINVGSIFEVSIDTGDVQFTKDATDLFSLPIGNKLQSEDRSALNRKRLDGINLLVADDSPDNRVLISRILQLDGAKVDLAEDGLQAVDKAFASYFDVILMDIQMPNMDGYEATETLRKRGYTRPVIALTAHAMHDELERCLRAGCNQHISKPVDRNVLVKAILKLTESSKEQARDAP